MGPGPGRRVGRRADRGGRRRDAGGLRRRADDVPAESLDDDAFFASLREAVRDDAPLGPGTKRRYFLDEEDTEEHRRLFRRRR